MFAGREPAVGADLGRDHERVAVAAGGHPLADDRLRDAHVRAHVGVGGVDEVPARLDVGVEHGERGVAIRGPAEHVAAEAEAVDVEVHGPQTTKRKRAPGGRPLKFSAQAAGARRVSATRWSRCTRTPPRRRTARRAPSCADLRRAQRDGAADDAEQDDAAEAAAALLLRGRLVQRDADVAHAARGLLDVLLQLLVLEDLLGRALAVAQPPVGVARGLVGLDDVLRRSSSSMSRWTYGLERAD